jgi:hypothetical protein
MLQKSSKISINMFCLSNKNQLKQSAIASTMGTARGTTPRIMASFPVISVIAFIV